MGPKRLTNASAPSKRRASTRNKAVTDENEPSGKKGSKSAAKVLDDRIAAHIDPYSDEMDVKFNIEGSAVQDIVYLRQSNDLAQKTILEQAAATAALEKELATLKARFAADITNQQREDCEDVDVPAGTDTDKQDELAKVKAANAELRKKIQRLTAADKVPEAEDAIEMVPRPAGSAGKDFNIQDEMGLGHKQEDRELYKGLMRNTRDLTLQAGINWELPWAKTPAEAKAKLYAVARERHPILKRYVNDWATEELVKQYIKNKRRHGYKKGWLEPPPEYAYLKANSAKRNPTAPRGRRAKRVAAVAAKKVDHKRKEVAGRASASGSKGKGKAKQVVVDDEESMTDGDESGQGDAMYEDENE